MRPIRVLIAAAVLGLAACSSGGQGTSRAKSTPVAARFISVVTAKGWQDPSVLPIAFQETGVKAGSQVGYRVTATAGADYGCFRSSGPNSTPDQMKSETVQGNQSATAQFSADANGFVQGVIVVSPPPPSDATCPPGSMLSIWRFSYSNIIISDLSNGVVHPAPELGYGGQS